MKMRLSEYLSRFGEQTRLPTPPPDDETQDRSLKALRRLRRTQLERDEKEMLRKRINAEIRRRDGVAFSVGYPIIQGSTGTKFRPAKKKGTFQKGNIL